MINALRKTNLCLPPASAIYVIPPYMPYILTCLLWEEEALYGRRDCLGRGGKEGGEEEEDYLNI